MSVAQFAMSLLAAERWSADLRSCGLPATPESLKTLARELETIDGQAFESKHGFWRGLIEFILDEEPPIDLKITTDPARSEPRF